MKIPPPSPPPPVRKPVQISWCDSRLAKCSSAIQGEGVFAVQKIAKNETVIIFGGHVVALEKLGKLESLNPSAYDTILETGYQIADELIYSPVEESQFSDAEFLNHCCNPNCGFKSEIALVAMRDIAAGEELTMDYAMCISHEIFEMECNCGSSNCRGYLSKDDWQNPALHHRYDGYFQPYLRQKIELLKSMRC